MRALPLALLLLATAAAAQPGTIIGTVTDDGIGLPAATVLLPGLDRSTTTDLDGRFAFDGVPTGVYDLEVRYVGYVTAIVEVEVGAPQSGGWTRADSRTLTRVGVELEMDPMLLCEVVVIREYERMSRGIYAARVASYHETRGPHDPWGHVPCESWPVPDPSPLLHARTR